MKISKSTATILVIIVCVAVVHITKFVIKRLGYTSLSQVALSRTKGSPKAPLRITEYIDFQCPACAKGATLLREYTGKYPSQVYFEVKYFPLPRIHQHALKSAVYAECAARQNKFWAFQDLLIKKQSQWARLLNAEPMFQEMAQSANLNLGELEACVNRDDIKVLIFREKSEGKSLGVNSTPTYFVNGKMIVGPKPLEAELNDYLKGKNHP